ncbi:MAG: hypothetical protein NZ961_25200 [Candidatus Poribacteria bacterium]|nr:hypothetical protein [Candidatus Poribacteria bacterium]
MDFQIINDICGKASEAGDTVTLEVCIADLGVALGMDDITKQKNHEYKDNYKFQNAVDYWSDSRLLMSCSDIDGLLETLSATETDIGTYLKNIVYEEGEYETVHDYLSNVFENDIVTVKLDLIGGYCFENIMEEMRAVEAGEGND